MSEQENHVSFNSIPAQWVKSMETYTPTGEQILDVLKGLAIASSLDDTSVNEEKIRDILHRLSGSTNEAFMLGAIGMLMTLQELDELSPQQALSILEQQLAERNTPAQVNEPGEDIIEIDFESVAQID